MPPPISHFSHPHLPHELLLLPLSAAEIRLLTLIRASGIICIVPDITIRAEKGNLVQITWQRSAEPQGFSPSKALREPHAVSLTSHVAEPGSAYRVRRHTVRYVEHFHPVTSEDPNPCLPPPAST